MIIRVLTPDEAYKFVHDAYAFLRWCIEEDQYDLIAPTLIHDICGLVKNEPGFSSRVGGYGELEEHEGDLNKKRR